MKKLYISAWFLLAAAVLFAAFSGVFSPAVLLFFSLVGLALIYTFALWSVISGALNVKTE